MRCTYSHTHIQAYSVHSVYSIYIMFIYNNYFSIKVFRQVIQPINGTISTDLLSSLNFGLVFCMSSKTFFKGILIVFNQVHMEIIQGIIIKNFYHSVLKAVSRLYCWTRILNKFKHKYESLRTFLHRKHNDQCWSIKKYINNIQNEVISIILMLN